MGAQFVYLDFDAAQDGAATGGYAAPSSPESREKQLAKFRELAPEVVVADPGVTVETVVGRRVVDHRIRREQGHCRLGIEGVGGSDQRIRFRAQDGSGHRINSRAASS